MLPHPTRKALPAPAPWRLAAVALASVLLASCGGGGGGGDGGGGAIQINTLSNRADLVSDGDALVEITAPPGQIDKGLLVNLNGANVASSFTRQGNGRLVGLLTGLKTGENTLEVQFSSRGIGQSERLVITNAPRSGPIYSGAQVKPFYCATPTPQPASGSTPATNGSGLSGQPDANCNIPTETKLYYRTTTASSGTGACSLAIPDPAWNSDGVNGTIPAQPAAPANPCWKPYTAGTTPADMATITTENGRTLPFVVRLERGTMNRGIYDIAVLFDPAKEWKSTAPQAQWNGKVYYSFGASTGQPRRQARPTATAWSAQEEQLKRGWLVVGNSMTDSVKNSNRVLMTETVMMMKEHIIDTYGPIRFTMGTGCSGGSINSNMNLSIFPGLLDGVVTSCTYPDSETTTLEVGDCTLLVEAYQKTRVLNLWSSMGLTQSQINARKGAINGHPDQSGCQAWYNAFGSNGRPGVYSQRTVGALGNGAQRLSDWDTGTIRTVPFETNNCELPNTAVYNPANPTATANLPRCNAWAWGESIWGHIGTTATPQDTRDNVGVQYGLKALLAGSITVEEFVTLNEEIGGTNKDSELRAARTQADTAALETAYRSGIVASGKNLAKAPIIDLRGWDDSNINVPPGQNPVAVNSSGTGLSGNTIPIHHQWYSWAIRDRITRDAGDANNQALWRFARTGLAAPGTVGLEAFNVMDQWLTALVTEPSNRSIEAKVRATRPNEARDFCLKPDDTTQSNRIYDMAVCDADPWLKPAASPRQVAGGPRSEDVLKCQLKPLNRSEYTGVAFTDAQWQRMQVVFQGGVCDWSKPGVGQQAAQSPLTFRNGPGGQPLGDAPTSTRF
ncbi:hypothetical protein H8N03_11730 [Ramlibacter sp. USB13]|uniref:DUF6351 domain-containing protein n=1 Tax=Ramlibacter cellulosilyticus TaxID=2764187 RepID=A0A923MPU3_9BURK|nr:DUF6351 family protein [Ramlibacter cellulosilyticus]MBC5783617.1 hypothetical protein [Ramlibacter cellulosilyticus]